MSRHKKVPTKNVGKLKGKAEKQDRYKRKKQIEKMPKWKRFLAKYGVAPIFFIIWMIDRAIHLLFPHSDHPKFRTYMLDATNNIKYTFIRVLIFGIPALIIAWIF